MFAAQRMLHWKSPWQLQASVDVDLVTAGFAGAAADFVVVFAPPARAFPPFVFFVLVASAAGVLSSVREVIVAGAGAGSGAGAGGATTGGAAGGATRTAAAARGGAAFAPRKAKPTPTQPRARSAAVAVTIAIVFAFERRAGAPSLVASASRVKAGGGSLAKGDGIANAPRGGGVDASARRSMMPSSS